MEIASLDRQGSTEFKGDPAAEPVVINERDFIKARRDAVRGQDDTGLSGLAFSGGGIRSATFGLGVLESLKELGLLEKFDYLSSVSGGGYISSWLSANCLRKPNWLAKGADWRESIAHLRKYSNYLSPQLGFFSADTWSMLTIWIRNTILVQLTVVLSLVLVMLLARSLDVPFQQWPPQQGARWLTVALFLLAVTGIGANLMQLQRPAASHEHKGQFSYDACGWRAWGAVALGALAGAVTIKVVTGFNPFIDGPANEYALPMALCLSLCAIALVPPVLKLRCLLPKAKPGCDEVIYDQSQVQTMVVLPMIFTAFLLAAVMWGLVRGTVPGNEITGMKHYGELVLKAWRHWPFPIAISFASMLILSCCSLRRDVLRDAGWRPFAYAGLAIGVSALSAAALHAMFCGILVLMQLFYEKGESGVWHALVWGPPLLLIAFSLAVTLQIGLLGRSSLEGMREWWSRLAAWVCIYAFGVWLAMVSALYGPLLTAWLVDGEHWPGISAVVAWIASTAGGLLAGNSNKAAGDDKIRSEPASSGSKVINAIALVAPYVFIAGLLLVVSSAIHVVLWNSERADGTWVQLNLFYANHWPYLKTGNEHLSWIILGCAIALGIFMWRVDINEFSLNAFYRNRLVRCYLGATRVQARKPQHFTGFDDADDLPMSELQGGTAANPVAAGPLHIVNCALNLGGSSDLSLHTRHSANFAITPYVMGSSYLKALDGKPGYQPHSDFRRPVTLGQAVAVSGAAASPNQGYHTSPAVAILLTMFNVRLGWWFANPARKPKHASPLLSMRYLLLELFGLADAGAKYVMVSDGGHFENLAMYELVRRRCKLIVASDAECDPEMNFEGLGTLIRMCKVDFDTEIVINVRDIRLHNGYSRSRFAVGAILYPDGTTGLLIYLKASMNGKAEDSSVQQYHATHPTFPHESTGDQFYAEDQFESYRRLGKELTDAVFKSSLSQMDWVELSKVWPEVPVPPSKITVLPRRRTGDGRRA